MKVGEDIKTIFSYLKKENINIDFEEFQFQVESHPDYPSLLSFSDALTFFNVNNMAAKLSFEELSLLPENFIALFKSPDKPGVILIEEFLGLVKKQEQNFLVNDKVFTHEEFKQQFQEIILLAEKSADFQEESKEKNNYILPILIGGLGFVLLFLSKTSWISIAFLFTSIIGILLSVETFKEILGIKSPMMNKVCNATETTNCESVLKSKKWKILDWLSLSDISIVFFSSQAISLFIFSILNQPENIFSFLSIGLWLTLPLSILSIFYQWKIEKKWCPICLMILTILYIQCFIIYSKTGFNFSFNYLYLLIGVIIISITMIWLWIKKLYLKNKDLKESNSKHIRFKRNYEMFKRSLTDKNKVVFPLHEESIVFGNKNSHTTITVITNPRCKFCKKVHETIDKILDKYGENLAVNIVFPIDINDQERVIHFKKIHSLYLQKTEKEFRRVLDNLYGVNGSQEAAEKQISSVEIQKEKELKLDEIFNNQSIICNENNINFTPLLLINGHIYPSNYDYEDLEFFINDLQEDSF